MVRAPHRISWLGHATVLIEAGGARLLTDPVLRRRVAHLVRRVPAAPHPRPVDAVLISHVHRDHLDRPSLRMLAGAGTEAVLPAGTGALLKGFGFRAVREVRPGDTIDVAGNTVEAVEAWHPARRHPGGRLTGALGYLCDGVWFAGDTDLHAGMDALRGRVAVALLPIWGWGPSIGPGHLDPERAARVVALVGAGVAVPVHWGTFLPVGMGRRHRAVLADPVRDFQAHVRRLAPATRVMTLRPDGSPTEL